jgi:ABC-type glycerol-3-phosphate transport system substrate-binding protein
MKRKPLTRRRLLATSSAACAATIASPFVRTAHAAGKLSLGFWDHFVPSANKTSDALIQEWAAKEKVDVQIDRYTGNKALLTLAAEAQARSGHDILYMTSWLPHHYAENFEPVDDVMAELIKQNGPVSDIISYLGRANGHWLAVPATIGNQIQGPCSRIDLMKQHAGIDVQAMYPPGAPPKADAWTLETFLKAAEACHKGGVPFGIGLGPTEDSVVAAGVIFQSFGAHLVDAGGKITVKSDAVRQALDYYTRLAKFFPPDAPAWDNTSQQQVADLGPRCSDFEPA